MFAKACDRITDQKFYNVNVLRASDGVLICRSGLHWLAPINPNYTRMVGTFLCVPLHKECLCHCSGNIKKLMMVRILLTSCRG
jgi:hypothetical protein